jgi:hypothetical protein
MGKFLVFCELNVIFRENFLATLKFIWIADFMIMMPCSLICGYLHFAGTFHLHLQGRIEDGGDRFHQNDGNHLQNYTAP